MKHLAPTLVLSSLLLGGCCALHCNCKPCSKKEIKQATSPAAVQPIPTVDPVVEDVPSATPTTEPESKKIGWELWAIAGGLVGVGAVLALINKKKITS